MAQQTINIGASPNDGTGTPLRTAFQYTNSNFSELYTAVGPSGNNIVVPGSATITGDLTVDTSTLKVDSANNRVYIGTTAAVLSEKFNVSSSSADTYALMQQGSGITALFGVNATGAYSGSYTNQPYLFLANNIEQYRISPLGVFTWTDGAGGTRMTLNATGLGVGVSPSATLDIRKNASGSRFLSYHTGGNGTVTAGADLNEMRCDDTTTAYNLLNINVLGTSRFLVTSTGNVGIGITPSAWATSTTVWRALDLQYSCGLASSGAGSGEIDLLWNAYYDQTDQRWEFKYTGDRASRYAIGGSGVHAWYNTASTGTANGAITWTQAMTLDASGNLLVGTTNSIVWNTTNQGCVIGGNAIQASRSGDTVLLLNRIGSNGKIAVFARQGLEVGDISVTTTGTTFNSTSDYRLKESVQPLVGGLARVSALKPSIYKWKSNGSSGEGFLAHELAEVVPAAVSGEKDAVNEDGSIKAQSIDMSRVVPILVAAIQELTARVQTLETR